MLKKIQNLCLSLILFIGAAACSARSDSPGAQAPVASGRIAGIIAKYRTEIPQHMQQDQIPGLVIAVVDDQNILWMESFGYTDWDRRTPVTSSTIFSLQSMSKSFTATAAMFAAQDGLVDLDAPITTYLPGFTVHSIFEEHPEQKMTLRILLSHTAGFPHDVFYGGNNDTLPFSVEKHNASISDSWLMFPVGTRYSYSNIGIDLAGYILSERAGMPFTQYVQQKVLDPLGMRDSTLDYRRVRATPTRAIGHTGDPVRPPVDFQLIPSGGVWTSAEDLARYIQFHMNNGALDGQHLLKEDLAETMYTPPNQPARAAYPGSGYALGVEDSIRNGARIIYHGGGGFGFNNFMAWYPELKLGALVLTNAHQTDGYSFNLCLNVLDDIIANDVPLYRQRYLHAAQITPAYPPDMKWDILTDMELRNLIESKALPEDSATQQRRSAYAGIYIMTTWGGAPGETIEIYEVNGTLAWTYHGELDQYRKSSRLFEIKPGLLLSESGSIFDLRGPVLMMDNMPLVKTNHRVLSYKIALYAVCGLAFLSTLFFWPVWALASRGRRSKGAAGPSAAGVAAEASPGRRWLGWAGALAVLASLLSLFCLLITAALPNLIYLPWPRPWPDLLWWQTAVLRLPFVSLAMALGVIMLSVLALRNRAAVQFRHAAQWNFLAVGLALLAFNVTILL